MQLCNRSAFAAVAHSANRKHAANSACFVSAHNYACRIYTYAFNALMQLYQLAEEDEEKKIKNEQFCY